MGLKPFAWSYSRVKQFDTCPKRYYEVDLTKHFKDSNTDNLDEGKKVHAALANNAMHGTPLYEDLKFARKWVKAYTQPGLGELLVECQFAITKDFQKTDWFGKNVWCRGVVDLARINREARKALVVDWKTGKMKHDARQLMLMAQMIFIHFPEIDEVHAEFVWLQEDCHTSETYYRDSIMDEWPPILDMVKQMEQAAKTMTYPPKPGPFCAKWCPVNSCPFHGKFR